jgi:DNA-directed RNA polymerase subunit RPC12/RpoP
MKEREERIHARQEAATKGAFPVRRPIGRGPVPARAFITKPTPTVTGDSFAAHPRDSVDDSNDDDSAVVLDVNEWACTVCAAPLEVDEVEQIKNNKVIECEYCGSSISKDQFT